MGTFCEKCSNKEKDEDSDLMNKEILSPKDSILTSEISDEPLIKQNENKLNKTHETHEIEKKKK